MIGGRRPIQGRKPGDRRIRLERPHSPYFRYTGPGQLTAKAAASAPTSGTGRLYASIRGFFVGRPLASEDELGERLPRKKALAIFSSDAISSSAYATEEILRVLILGGVAALAYGLQVSIAIVILLVVVAISYRQICIAYPIGGGSYSVSRRNIGRTVSLVAASALLIDYVLTVAVSTTSAVEQITSAIPALIDWRVYIGVGAIGLITIGNLRGLREAQSWPPDREAPMTIVVLPEYVARHWWDQMLYNQTAKRLKAALVGREHTVIADVPYRRGH